MGNTLPSYGVITTDQFMPALRQRCQRLSTFASDFSAAIQGKGNVVNVPYQSTTSASQWNSTNLYTAATETVSSVDVTLEEPLYKEFFLSPLESGTYTQDFLVSRMESAVNSVLDEVEKKAYAALALNCGTVGAISGSAVKFGLIQSGSNVLIFSGSQGEISMFCPTANYSQMQADAKSSGYGMWDIVSKGGDAFQYGDATVRRVPKLTDNTYVYFATPDAVAIALRLPPVLNGYNRTLIVDEPTGLTIAVDLLEDAVGGIIRGRAHLIEGVARGRAGSAARWSVTA